MFDTDTVARKRRKNPAEEDNAMKEDTPEVNEHSYVALFHVVCDRIDNSLEKSPPREDFIAELVPGSVEKGEKDTEEQEKEEKEDEGSDVGFEVPESDLFEFMIAFKTEQLFLECEETSFRSILPAVKDSYEKKYPGVYFISNVPVLQSRVTDPEEFHRIALHITEI
jgi:hypothetical protein